MFWCLDLAVLVAQQCMGKEQFQSNTSGTVHRSHHRRMPEKPMNQTITTTLKDLVERAKCKPGWQFSIAQLPTHFELIITVHGPDSREAGDIGINHHFPVPHASFNARTWRRWLFECCKSVEHHELGEWFRIDDFRPFAPMHAPGWSPYDNFEVVTEIEANTDQLGEVTGNIRVPRSEE
jgi:hypothetical protein